MPRHTANFENIPKTLGGDKRGLGALMFDDHVGGHRCAMTDKIDVSAAKAAHLQDPPEAVDRAHHSIGRRGRHLDGPMLAAAVVYQDDIGEGASDVDAQSPQKAHSLN